MYHLLFRTLFDQEEPMIKNGDKNSSQHFETTSNRLVEPNMFTEWKKDLLNHFLLQPILIKGTNDQDRRKILILRILKQLSIYFQTQNWLTDYSSTKSTSSLRSRTALFLDSHRETTFVP